MTCDSLARKAILFVTFITATTILYGFTTRFLFAAPNYDDVSIDPEGGSYYDYGSKVAAAVWKGAGQWIGMTGPDPTNVTVISGAASEDAIDESQGTQELELDSILSDGLELKPASVASVRAESTTRSRRLRSRRVHLLPDCY